MAYLYCKALSDDRIRAELEKSSGAQFDPEYLSVFLELLEEGQL